MEIIDLDLDDENEMMFKVQIEGTRPGEPLCRLMIENNDISHSITGNFLDNNEVCIVIPPMKKILKEGSYNSYLEVFVDDRVFIPLELKINFEESVKVVAESIVRGKRKSNRPTASLLSTSAKRKRSVVTEKLSKTKQNPKDEDNIFTESHILALVEKLKDKAK